MPRPTETDRAPSARHPGPRRPAPAAGSAGRAATRATPLVRHAARLALGLLVSCAGPPTGSEPASGPPAGPRTPQPAGFALPAADAPPLDRPYVVVLGTAQDAGLPQIGCRGSACEAARRDPRRRRLVASLLLADTRSGARWLFDATPDVREQVERARGHPPTRVDEGPRPPLFDGVFLTHAHMGHVSGLLQFGREAYAAHDLPVFGSPRLIDFLTSAEPYAFLARAGYVAPVMLEPGVPRPLHADGAGRPDLSVVALPVPHRDEFSDTVAYLLRGPSASLLYLPDIDRWPDGATTLLAWVATVDVALVDGTFFDGDEVPGRDLADVPHPTISTTLALLADAPLEERRKIVFTHLNHGNPAADPSSAATERIRAAGLRVAREGEIIGL